MGSGDGDRPGSLEELRGLSAAKIRRLLNREGVSDHGCIEKADYVALAARVLGLAEGGGDDDAALGGGGGAAPGPRREAAQAAPAAASADGAETAEAAGDGGPKVPLARRSESSESLRTEWTYAPSESSSSRCSRSRSRSPPPNGRGKDWGLEVVKISADDAAALAMGNKHEKISRVSEAELTLLDKQLILEMRGTPVQRKRAKKYANMVMRMRLGPHLMMEDFDDGDLTVVSVPPDVVGYVQGQGGGVLRSIEEEWGTLMFFIDNDLTRAQRVAIFGSIRGRRGSELKVLSAIETKMPGYILSVRDEVINRDKYKDPTGTWGTDWMTFRDEGEISYALGKQGGTRRKLERSSGAVVQYVGMMAICSGTRIERTRAKEYMKWLFQQLEGPVYVYGWDGREDCTVVDIPNDCIGYITGNRRAALGAMEEEWGSLMFFMSEHEERGRGRGGTERLVIFGPDRCRRGSELKIMSSIETKSPGFFTRGLREKTSERKGFDTDRLLMRDEEVSYALGKDGATRKKLELASGAILQYVGHVAFVAGDLPERRRCREFVQWLLQQRRGAVTIENVKSRDDCTEVHIPANCKGWVAGNRGSELRRMEQASGTYMFMALDARGEERLLIFGVNPGRRHGDGGRAHAERLVKDLIREKLEDDNASGGRKRRRGARSSSSSSSDRRRGSGRRRD